MGSMTLMAVILVANFAVVIAVIWTEVEIKRAVTRLEDKLDNAMSALGRSK